MLAKIKAGVDTRRDGDLQIVARTDARAVLGLQAAIDRAVSDKTFRRGDLPLAPWLIGVVINDVDAEGTQRVSHQLGVTRL